MKIIQISDTHISKNPNDRIFGLVNTENTFIDVLHAVEQEQPDLILATGDLSQDGSISSYQRLQNYLSTLKCNIYSIYGNHDNPENFDKWLIGNNVYKIPTLETDVGTFIFLSSYKADSDSGYIDSISLKHLVDSLERYDNCIIVIHHHFVPLNASIDTYILENSTSLIKVLKLYKSKIKFCITGHVHNFYQTNLDGIMIYSGLSTCIQFAKTQNLLFENKKPGFIVYDFEGNNYAVIEKTI